jgi:predicted RND superfamily exporter protein
MMKTNILCLFAILMLASCTITRQNNQEKTKTETDVTTVTDTVEKVDTTATLKADTANYNNLPLTIFTDTTDTTPVVFENAITKVIIKKKKTGKVDLTVIKKEEKVTVQFERRTHTKKHMKKTVRTANRSINTKTSYGPMFYIVPGICLLLLILLYWLYRRWKRGLLKFP